MILTVLCKNGGAVKVEGCGRWSVPVVYWTLHGFVCVSWVVVGESGSALGDRRVCA